MGISVYSSLVNRVNLYCVSLFVTLFQTFKLLIHLGLLILLTHLVYSCD